MSDNQKGLGKKEEDHKLLGFHKALYGLRQSLRIWNIKELGFKLHKCLEELGFKQNINKHIVYIKND